MEEDKTTVGANINQVLENIKNACKKSGRNPEDVTLIAVSKTKPLHMRLEAGILGKIRYRRLWINIQISPLIYAGT